MQELDHVELQQQYGGRYVALRCRKVVLSAATYDELADQLELLGVGRDGLLVAYIDPPDVVAIY